MQSYHARLMSGRLPVQIDPIRLADEGARLVGQLPLSEFSRLREFQASGANLEPVDIDLVFERTLQGVRLMRGLLRARIQATCQRCLEPVGVDIKASPLIELLRPGDVPGGLADNADSLVVEGLRKLSELVEDELLLVMPMVPMHDEGGCTAPVSFDEPSGQSPGKSGPFTALRQRDAKGQ